MASEHLIKYVLVMDNSDTWLQMANSVEELKPQEGYNHVERWHYSSHERGHSLMFKEKAGDKVPLFIKWLNLPPLDGEAREDK